MPPPLTTDVRTRPAALPTLPAGTTPGTRLVVALGVLVALALPLRAAAQSPPPVTVWEDSLASADRPVRARAVEVLTERAPELTPAGRTTLIALFARELDVTAPAGDVSDEDDEAYSHYIMALTQLVSRLNDPRALPALARAVGYAPGAAFTVAASGDARIDALVDTWQAKPALRMAVIRTMALMRQYADSAGHPLSDRTRSLVGEYFLRAASAPETWLRTQFIDAVALLGDGSFLPIIADLTNDREALPGGVRPAARDASRLLPVLMRVRDAQSSTALLSALRTQTQAACATRWITGDRLCAGFDLELRGAEQALASGKPDAARLVLLAFGRELDALKGKHVSPRAWALLAPSAQYLAGRLQP